MRLKKNLIPLLFFSIIFLSLITFLSLYKFDPDRYKPTMIANSQPSLTPVVEVLPTMTLMEFPGVVPTATPKSGPKFPTKEIPYQKNKWTSYFPVDELPPMQSFDLKIAHDGAIWASSEYGLFRLEGNQLIRLLDEPQNGVGQFVFDRKGNIWARTDFGISKFNGKSWENFPEENFTSPIVVDQKDRIWVSTTDGKVKRFDGTSWKTYPETDPVNRIREIIVDTHNVVWVAAGSELWRIDEDRMNRFPLTLFWAEDAIEGYIHSLAASPDGGIWFMLGSEHLTYIKNGKWVNYDLSFTFPMNPTAFEASARGGVWIGFMSASQDSLVYFDGKELTVYKDLDLTVFQIKEDQSGNLWIIGNGIIQQYNRQGN